MDGTEDLEKAIVTQSLDEKQKLSYIIWANIDRLLNEQDKDYKWLAEKTGVNASLYYGNKYRKTDFSIDRILLIAKAFDVSIASLCTLPEAQFSSRMFLVESGDNNVDGSNYLSVFMNYLPKLSTNRQRAIYEVMLSFFDTNSQELRSQKEDGTWRNRLFGRKKSERTKK